MNLVSRLRRGVQDPTWAIRRSLWQLHQLRPDSPLTVSTRHGLMSVSPRDQIIGKLLYTRREYEFDSIERALAILLRERPESAERTLLDVGANIGTICVPLMLKGAFKRCIAFEPDSLNFSLLERNVTQNSLTDRVRMMRVALSDRDGSAYLSHSDTNYGDHRIAESGSVRVETRALDGIAKPGEVGVIWMDVQGHEPAVLRGATALLEARTPLVTEFWPYGLQHAGSDPEEFLRFLSKHYERFCDLKHDRVRPISELQMSNLDLRGNWITDLLLL